MNYSFIPFLLIIIGVGLILVVIIRRFPQLPLIDVDSMPRAKEEKKKNALMKKQVEKRLVASRERWQRRVLPLVAVAKRTQLAFRKLVGRMERMVILAREKRRREKPIGEQMGYDEQRRQLIDEGTLALSQNNLQAAEMKYIAAIRIDPKSEEAYRGLGDVYAGQGQKKEAKETFEFLLKLNPANEYALMQCADLAIEEGKLEEAVSYYQQAVLVNPNLAPRFFKLAELLKDLGQHETALEAIMQAVELEPENPKYLDFLVEVSILAGDKNAAEEGVQRLRMANPDNQKLDVLRDKIRKMEST